MNQPTQARVRELLDYDPATGVFRWRETRGGVRVGSIAGRVNARGYCEIGVDGRLAGAHRLAWIHVHGAIVDGRVVDHIDGNKCDNRLCNLRAVTVSENNRNRHRPAGKNPVVGVSWDKARGKWRADLKVADKCVTVGRFDTVSAAATARARAVIAHGIWPELVTAEHPIPAEAA